MSFFGFEDLSWDSDGDYGDAPRHGGRAQSSSRSEADVTCPNPASTPSSTPTRHEHPLEDILDEPEYDRISDKDDVKEAEACFRRDPLAIRRRAMATDFSEGRLETFVDSPLKELSGTQNQYVSYQVTTKVGIPCAGSCCA